MKSMRKEIIEFIVKLISIFGGVGLYTYFNPESKYAVNPAVAAVALSVLGYTWAETWGNFKAREKADDVEKEQKALLIGIKRSSNDITHVL